MEERDFAELLLNFAEHPPVITRRLGARSAQRSAGGVPALAGRLPTSSGQALIRQGRLQFSAAEVE